jgi:hypothetical protein
MGMPATLAAQRTEAPTAADTAQTPAGAPVVGGGDTVLFVPVRHGAFTSEARVSVIAQRIQRLSRTGVDSLVLSAGETSTDIMAHTYSLLHSNIEDKFNESGVEIMSPHCATLRDGNMTTIPTNYPPKDYAQMPFRVQRVGSKED